MFNETQQLHSTRVLKYLMVAKFLKIICSNYFPQRVRKDFWRFFRQKYQYTSAYDFIFMKKFCLILCEVTLFNIYNVVNFLFLFFSSNNLQEENKSSKELWCETSASYNMGYAIFISIVWCYKFPLLILWRFPGVQFLGTSTLLAFAIKIAHPGRLFDLY